MLLFPAAEHAEIPIHVVAAKAELPFVRSWRNSLVLTSVAEVADVAFLLVTADVDRLVMMVAVADE